MENVEFVDEKERELFARARLSESVLDFLRSDVGRYLHGRAKLELEEAKDQLLDCNPFSFWGRRKMRKIQMRAEVARSFMRYVSDAITDGEIAYQELKEREDARLT